MFGQIGGWEIFSGEDPPEACRRNPATKSFSCGRLGGRKVLTAVQEVLERITLMVISRPV